MRRVTEFYYESIQRGKAHFVTSRKTWPSALEAFEAGRRFSARHGYIFVVHSTDGTFWARSDNDAVWEKLRAERRAAKAGAK